MAIAAVPKYLGKDFSTASPGMRFGMYLSVWSNQDWSRAKSSVEALKGGIKLNDVDKKHVHKLLQRQQQLAAAQKQNAVVTLDAIATAPFTTGLGNEHPLENGFAFLNPYGLPYLPGSGVKGVLRQAAHELISGDWGDAQGWTKDAALALFGSLDSNNAQRGALSFWDVIPELQGEQLAVEIMTPHQGHYYRDGATPHDSGQPIPISFLTVPPGSGFTFHVLCDLEFLERLDPGLAQDNRWKTLLQSAFDHAFDWLGFGAKTAVGYGAMAADEGKAEQRKQALEEQRKKEALAQMTPEEREQKEHQETIASFQKLFEESREKPYQPGAYFDSKRTEFIDTVLKWEDAASRAQATNLLEETFRWGRPKSKKARARYQKVMAELKGE